MAEKLNTSIYYCIIIYNNNIHRDVTFNLEYNLTKHLKPSKITVIYIKVQHSFRRIMN